MSFLRIKKHGQVISEISLEPTKMYLGGRGNHCDIKLDADKRISREHFRLRFENDIWILENISKLGEISKGGERVSEIRLDSSQVFAVAQYDCEFLLENPSQVAHQVSQSPAIVSPRKTTFTDHGAAAQLDEVDFSERTFVGQTGLVGQISFQAKDGIGQITQSLQGAGPWLAGREVSCAIHINDSHVSRRQFEIQLKGSDYLITDLGSVNGTQLNQKPLEKNQPTSLNSGDEIRVLSNILKFELVNPDIQSQISNLRLPTVLTQVPDLHIPDPAAQSHIPLDFSQPPPLENKPQNWILANKMRAGLIAVILVLIPIVFLSPDKDKETPKPTLSNNPFDKLTKEQQSIVKQSLQLGRNYLMQGKYELALGEIAKLREYIPQYEDSEELSRMAQEGLTLLDEKRRNEAIEQAKAEQEQKILAQVKVCEKMIGPNTMPVEMDRCLSPVIEYNPEHTLIKNLKARVEQLQVQRQVQETQRRDYQSRVQKLENLFSQALSVEKSGDLLKAIELFQRISSTDLPDPKGLKEKSKQKSQNLKSEIGKKTQALQKDAERTASSGDLKSAILHLRRAKIIDPDNSEIQNNIDKYTLELRKQMMLLYQEGVIEENYGNVDGGDGKLGAKDKWKRILEQDIPEGEYYQKARVKLKKYGVI